MIDISEMACFSLANIRNKNNEDCILAPIQINNNEILLAIADGVGSLKGSGNASKSVISSILSSTNQKTANIQNIFRNAYKSVCSLDEKVATTLTVVNVNANNLIVGHIGDCRAYYLQNNKLVQITNDHNKYQKMISSGEFNAYQLRKHKERLSSVLTSAIAKEHSLDYETLSIDLSEILTDDYLVIYLMSDGAYKHWDKRKRFSEKTMCSPSAFSTSLKRRIEKDILDDYSFVGVKVKFSNS